MEHEYMRRYSVKENDFIVDLGATQGDFLKELLPQVKAQNAFMLCVEPDPYNVSALSSFIFTNALQYATILYGMSGSKCELGSLVVTDQAVLHHNVKVDKQRWGYVEKGIHKCPIYDLNTILEYSTKGVIDFIKCDIEGGELDTFIGAQVDWTKIKALAIAAYHVVDGERTYKKLSPYFTLLGYTVEEVVDLSKDDRDMIYAWRE